MSTVKELQTVLDKYHPDDPIAWTIWNREDIYTQLSQMDISLTRGDIEAILHRLHNSQDAEHGINWDTIEYCIREYLESVRNDQTIQITVKSGCVIAVDNLPDGWLYQVKNEDE